MYRIHIALAALLLFVSPTLAQQAAPPARPAAVPTLPTGRMKTLEQVCKKLSQQRWGPAVVETFEQPESARGWSATNGKVAVKNGSLVVDFGKNISGYVVHKLPAKVSRGPALRVDVWFTATPTPKQHGQASVYLSSNGRSTLYDYLFSFAFGVNGQTQRFTSRNGQMSQSSRGPDFDPKIEHRVRFAVYNQQWDCQLDKQKAVTGSHSSLPSLTLNDQSHFGFYMIRFDTVAIRKIAYRVAEPITDVDKAGDLFNGTGFADQAELTAFLLDNVIPHLDSPRWQTRRQATDLLERLSPLSRPAAEAALKGKSLSAEMRQRLEYIRDYSPAIKIVDPIDTIDEAPSASTRPDDNRP